MVSIWEKETFFAPHDIIIIGSGFTGLWCALHLKLTRPKLKISIIDRGVIPTGASTRNAGFACFGSLSELIQDGKKMGADKMSELVEMRYQGIERIRKFFPDKKIDFTLAGGYELYAKDFMTNEELRHNIDYANAFLRPVTNKRQTFKLADQKLTKFGFEQTKHLLKNILEGQLHSGKLLQALLQTVQSMGVYVFNNIEVKECLKVNERLLVQTKQGFHLSSKQVLICTNAFAKELLPELDIIPARGQVLVTSPIDSLPWKGSFHSEEGYYYFRNLGKRVLLGGGRHKAFNDEASTVFEITNLVQGHLEKYLEEVILPHQKKSFTIDYRWSGIMAMGSDKMPIVKEASPEVFCAVRMSGMGVSLAPVIGKKIARMMLD